MNWYKSIKDKRARKTVADISTVNAKDDTNPTNSVVTTKKPIVTNKEKIALKPKFNIYCTPYNLAS